MNKIIKEKIESIKKEVSGSSFQPSWRVIELLDELSAVIDAADVQEAGGEYKLDAEAKRWMESVRDHGYEVNIIERTSSFITFEFTYYGNLTGLRGRISNEGLADEELKYKIARLSDIESRIRAMEEMDYEEEMDLG